MHRRGHLRWKHIVDMASAGPPSLRQLCACVTDKSVGSFYIDAQGISPTALGVTSKKWFKWLEQNILKYFWVRPPRNTYILIHRRSENWYFSQAPQTPLNFQASMAPFQQPSRVPKSCSFWARYYGRKCKSASHLADPDSKILRLATQWQHGPCVLALALLLSQIPPAHIDDQVIAPLQSATEIPYYVGPGLPARILQPSTLRRKTLAVMATR